MQELKLCVAAATVAMLCACATDGGSATATSAQEVALSKAEVQALHDKTIIDYKMDNGDSGRSVHAGDGTVETTYVSRSGKDADKGRIVYKDDGEVCFEWQKWEGSCWKDYKVGDRYLSREVGGKNRTIRFSVKPQG